MSDFPNQPNAYAAPASTNQPIATELKGPGWAKFMGIITLLQAVTIGIYIVTLPLAIPMFMSGLAMIRASDDASSYAQNNDPAKAVDSMSQFVRAMRLQGIVTLVMFVLVFVGVAVFAAIGVAGLLPKK